MRRLTLSIILPVLIGTVSTTSPARALTNQALLDTIQHNSFQFFWAEVNGTNGLIRDRDTPGSPCSIASNGFGLSAICIGIDHGWITREQGRNRVLTTLKTFWNGPQGFGTTGYIGFKGLFYHFLDMNTGTRAWNSELSTIDTALLLAGIIDCKQYFDESHAVEDSIRALADSIYFRMDWDFMRNFNPGILMGWTPETNFGGFGQWIGYNEAMILYILALGSPTHPVPESAWTQWTSGYSWQTHYNYSYVNFPPLFGHQYSHCWIDFRNIQDDYMRGRGITYFENSRRATLAQQAFADANPFGWAGYSDSLWGFTASDVPTGYSARGAPPPQNDDGTITPTAPVSSLPFAPEEVLRTVHNMWNSYGPQLWTPYGFRDAFNLTFNWWGPDVIGIDQGPQVLMIENYLTGRVWNRFMENPHVQTGLTRAGFLTATTAVTENPPGDDVSFALGQATNPVLGATAIQYRIPAPGRVRLAVFDVRGREISVLVDGYQAAGEHSAGLDVKGFKAGVYFYRLEFAGKSKSRRFVYLQ